MDPTLAALAWVGLASLAAFIMAGPDKRAARRGGRRIAEPPLPLTGHGGGRPAWLCGTVVFPPKAPKPASLLPYPMLFRAPAFSHSFAYLGLSEFLEEFHP